MCGSTDELVKDLRVVLRTPFTLWVMLMPANNFSNNGLLTLFFTTAFYFSQIRFKPGLSAFGLSPQAMTWPGQAELPIPYHRNRAVQTSDSG
jgi:hypothetical protein